MSINTLLFDLGNVILPLDYQKTIQAFQNLGLKGELDASHLQDELLFRYEVGAISSIDFRQQLKQRLKLNINDEDFDKAWNAMLLAFPIEHLDFLRQIKAKNCYRTFLYSNINDLHYQGVVAIGQQQHGNDFFAGCFDKEYYSHLLGHRKPDASGFLKIIEENNLRPEQTVFIDDLAINIEGAKKVGLKTIHFTKELTLFDLPELIADLNK